jgi:hypothetical protein
MYSKRKNDGLLDHQNIISLNEIFHCHAPCLSLLRMMEGLAGVFPRRVRPHHHLHAVPIVAPPKEEKSASKAPKKKAELVKEDTVETVELKPDTVDKEQEKVKPEIVKEVESSSSISASAEPSAPPAEEGSPDQAQNLPVENVPVVQGRIIIQADSDTCSDSGNDSEQEIEGGLAERAEAIPEPGPPSFAANLSMDHDNEKSR